MGKQKKYALNNSYFKFKSHDMPDTILEIAKYWQEKGELPFEFTGDLTDAIYEAFVERQKRRGVNLSQFLTPTKTAQVIAGLVNDFVKDKETTIIDACCGTGQLTNQLIGYGHKVKGFDIDYELVELCQLLYEGAIFERNDFRDVFIDDCKAIVSNPPYEQMSDFFFFLERNLQQSGIAVLLLPIGTIDKEKPKSLFQMLKKYECIHREPMQEDFARTKISAEIVVLLKH